MIIEYYCKNVYGVEMKYVSDKKIASMIYLLTGKKTVTNSNVLALEGLGFELREVLQNN